MDCRNTGVWRASLAKVSGRDFPMSGIFCSEPTEAGSISAKTGLFWSLQVGALGVERVEGEVEIMLG